MAFIPESDWDEYQTRIRREAEAKKRAAQQDTAAPWNAPERQPWMAPQGNGQGPWWGQQQSRRLLAEPDVPATPWPSPSPDTYPNQFRQPGDEPAPMPAYPEPTSLDLGAEPPTQMQAWTSGHQYPGSLPSVLGDVAQTFGSVNQGLRNQLPGYAGLADVTGNAFAWSQANITEPYVGALERVGDVGERQRARRAPVYGPPIPIVEEPPVPVSLFGRELPSWAQPQQTPRRRTANGSRIPDAWDELAASNPVSDAVEDIQGAINYIQAAGGIPQAWSQLGSEERARAEIDPVGSLVKQAIFDPLIALPFERLGMVLKGGGKLAAEGIRAAAPKVAAAAPKVARAVEDVATLPLVRRMSPGGTVEAVGTEAATPAAKRFYHGTGSAFDSPDAARFDPNGLYGPGYYLTSSPEVAGSYAFERVNAGDWQGAMSGLQKQIDYAKGTLAQDITPERRTTLQNALRLMEDQLDRVGPSGSNVRAVSVPESLRLLDAAEPIPDDALSKIAEALNSYRDGAGDVWLMNFKRGLLGAIAPNEARDGSHVYESVRRATGLLQRDALPEVNRILQGAGYDGIRYQGGKRTPMRGPDGRPIEHEVLVIFPESLPKIKNAISGLPMGSTPEVGGAVVGGIAYQDDPALTPAENMQRRLLYAAGGATLGHVAKRLGGNSRLGATVEDVGKGREGMFRSTGKERAATGLTKEQEQFLTSKLEQAAPKLPEKISSYTAGQYREVGDEMWGGAYGQWPRISGGQTIHIPDDGSVTVHSQEQANNLHYQIAGKPIEGMQKPPIQRMASSASYSEPYRFNAYKEADDAMRAYGHPTRAAGIIEKQIAQFVDAPAKVQPTDLQNRRLQEIIAELRLRAEGRTGGNPAIKHYGSAMQTYDLEREMARLTGEEAPGRWAMPSMAIERGISETSLEVKPRGAGPASPTEPDIFRSLALRIQSANKPSDIYRLDTETMNAAISGSEMADLRRAIDRRLEEFRVRAASKVVSPDSEQPIWAMTQDEYLGRRRQVARGNLDPEAVAEARVEHRDEVIARLRSGGDVPQRVLDYYGIPPDYYGISPETYSKSRAQLARETEEAKTRQQLQDLKEARARETDVATTHATEVQAVAQQAASMPYEQVVNDEPTLRGLMEWYYTQTGNRGMASRMRQGDTIPRVEVSKAQRMAQEQLGMAEPPAEAPATAAKEPWQMTNVEYSRSRVPENIRDQIATPQRAFAAQHQVEIEAAMQRGQPVPPEVLADYPDLAAKAAPSPARGGVADTTVPQAPVESIHDRLAGRTTARIGTVIHGDDQLALSLRPDNSAYGTYSAVLTGPNGSQSIRMQYKASEPLSDVAKNFEEYLNIDNTGAPFRVEITEAEARARAVAAKVPEDLTPYQQQVKQWKAQLREREAKRFKTRGDELAIDRLRRQIAADPAKWQAGQGVAWKVTGDQINRGFRVIDVRPDTGQAVIRQVADTGLTTTGGDYDRISDQLVDIVDLTRDKKYDAAVASTPKPQQMAAPTRPRAELVPELPPAQALQAVPEAANVPEVGLPTERPATGIPEASTAPLLTPSQEKAIAPAKKAAAEGRVAVLRVWRDDKGVVYVERSDKAGKAFSYSTIKPDGTPPTSGMPEVKPDWTVVEDNAPKAIGARLDDPASNVAIVGAGAPASDPTVPKAVPQPPEAQALPNIDPSKPPTPNQVVLRLPPTDEYLQRLHTGGLLRRWGQSLVAEEQATKEMASKGVQQAQAGFRPPGLRRAIGAIDPGLVVSGLHEEAAIIFRKMEDTAANVVRVALTRLEGLPMGAVKIKSNHFVEGVQVNPRYRGAIAHTEQGDMPLSLAISDVMEYPALYDMPTETRAWIREAHQLQDEFAIQRKAEGVPVKQRKFDRAITLADGTQETVRGHYIGRLVTEVRGATNRLRANPDMSRAYDSMEAAIQRGVKYEDEPLAVMDAIFSSHMRRIIGKRMAKLVEPLGRKPSQLIGSAIQQGVDDAAAWSTAVRDYDRLLRQIRDGLPATYSQQMPGAPPGTKARMPLPAIDAKKPGTINSIEQASQLTGSTRNAEFKVLLDEAKQWRQQAVISRMRAREVKRRAMEQLTSREPFVEGAKFGRPEPTIATGHIRQSWASGKLFPRDVADYLNKQFGHEQSEFMKSLSTVNDAMRAIKAGMDLGVVSIQLQPLISPHPRVWARASRTMFEVLGDPATYKAYMRRPETQDVMAKLVPHGLNIESLEYGAGLARGTPVGGVLERFGARERAEMVFMAPINVAKVELAKSLLPQFERAGKLDDLATFLNNVTGTRSSLETGIGAPQRAAESTVLFFSPRMTRSALALVGDAMQPTLTGLKANEARKALGGLLVSSVLIAGGLRKALGQEITGDFFDPTSPEFLSAEVFGFKVGFGGTHRSLSQLMGQTLQVALRDPEQFLDVGNRQDNPFTRWWTSRATPVTGMAWDIVQRHDFIGEPLETPADWAAWGAEKLVPMWLQDYVPGPGRDAPELASLIPNVLGMNVRPFSPAQKRDRLRDQYARDDYGVTSWEALSRPQQVALEAERPDLVAAAQKAIETYGRRGSVLHQYRQEQAKLRKKPEAEMAALTKQLRQGEISGYNYRKAVQEREAEIAKIPEQLQTVEQFKDVPLKAEEWEAWAQRHGIDMAERTSPVDLFLDAYYSLTDKYRDPDTGEVEAAALVKARERLKAQTPADVVKEVTAYLNRHRAPELVKAQVEFNQYMQIPKYIGIGLDEQEKIDRVGRFIEYAKAELGDIEKAKAAASRAFGDLYGRYVMTRREKFRNPERAKYRREHPLIDKFYGRTPAAAEFQAEMPANVPVMAGR